MFIRTAVLSLLLVAPALAETVAPNPPPARKEGPAVIKPPPDVDPGIHRQAPPARAFPMPVLPPPASGKAVPK